MTTGRDFQVILLQREAPAKPVPGAACNGCGVCCLSEPCPLGMVLSGHRHGACSALRWHEVDRRYLCGAMAEPDGVLQASLPAALQWARPALARMLQRWAGRWIAASTGCDSDWLAAASSTMATPPGADAGSVQDIPPHSRRAP